MSNDNTSNESSLVDSPDSSVNETPRSNSSSNIEPVSQPLSHENIYTLETLSQHYKNRLVSFSSSTANGELISKFARDQILKNNAEIIKLNTLQDYGLLRFRPQNSTREYILLGHILCTHNDCQKLRPTGPFAAVFEGGNKKGADLRTKDSVELKSAKVLGPDFDKAYDEAWLTKIQLEKSPDFQPLKINVRKGGTKQNHTKTHTFKTPSPNQPAGQNFPINSVSPPAESTTTDSTPADSTPAYLNEQRRGSKFTRSIGVTEKHRRQVGFSQVLMQLDTHCSFKSQDSYYLRDRAKIIADTSFETGIPGDELVYGHTQSRDNLLSMAELTDKHHTDLIRQAQKPYGNHFVQYSSDQTTINGLKENHQSITDLSMKVISFDSDDNPVFYSNLLELTHNPVKEHVKTKSDLGSDSWSKLLVDIGTKLGIEIRGGLMHGFCTSDNCKTALAAIRKAFVNTYGCIAHRTSTIFEKAEEAFSKKTTGGGATFKEQMDFLQKAVAKLAYSLLKIPNFSTTRRWRGLFFLIQKFLEKYQEIERESASRIEKERYTLPSRLFLEDFLQILRCTRSVYDRVENRMAILPEAYFTAVLLIKNLNNAEIVNGYMQEFRTEIIKKVKIVLVKEWTDSILMSRLLLPCKKSLNFNADSPLLENNNDIHFWRDLVERFFEESRQIN